MDICLLRMMHNSINDPYINTFINHLFCFLKQYPFVTCISQINTFTLCYYPSYLDVKTIVQGSFPFPEKWS